MYKKISEQLLNVYYECLLVWLLIHVHIYTCRFVSTILIALKQMHTQPHTHAHATHKHAHTTMCIQDGFFPLYAASQEGHDSIVEKLLQAGATVDLQTKV